MATNSIWVRRVMSPEKAGELIGEPVPAEVSAFLIERQPGHGDPVWIRDADTEEIIGIITRMPNWLAGKLRRAVTSVEMYATGVGRARLTRAYAPARTFGFAPRKPQGKREACHATSLDRDYPDQAAVLRELSGYLGREFREMMPLRAVQDLADVRRVHPDWLLDDDSLWTSGVINRSAQLPYHQDGSNFHTWSAMPTLRFATRGGHLHLPEYGFCFPCRDGEVTWFCGRDLVHGVTPMRGLRADAYRYSIVYYALAGMVNCRAWVEEEAYGKRRRTERERAIVARDRAAGREALR